LELWEPFKIERGKEYHWQIGPLKIWLEKIEDELLIASEQSPDDLESEQIVIAKLSEKPETPEWTRFVCAGPDTIQLLPALQDRAIVVGSEMKVKILKENSALFFVTIPVWVRIYVGDKKATVLTEIPTVSLSNTWFGDPMTGELCYSLTTKARRSIGESDIHPHRAICPVKITNRSTNPLDFQKFSIHVEHLKVYAGQKTLWTNEVKITFFCEDQPSKIDFSDKKPDLAKGCVLLSKERTPIDRSLLKKGVSFFKYFTSFES
jgi:hypothetical protein